MQQDKAGNRQRQNRPQQRQPIPKQSELIHRTQMKTCRKHPIEIRFEKEISKHQEQGQFNFHFEILEQEWDFDSQGQYTDQNRKMAQHRSRAAIWLRPMSYCYIANYSFDQKE